MSQPLSPQPKSVQPRSVRPTVSGGPTTEQLASEAGAVRPDLICIAHLRWDFVFQRPQHLMTRAARERRVFYVEPPVFGEPDPERSGADWMERRQDPSGVTVCVPHVAVGYSAEESQARTAALLGQLVQGEQLTEYVLWVYTPMELPITAQLSPSVTVYDCMDELANFRGAAPELREREQQLFGRADLVFTGGYRLWEAKRAQHPHAFPFPSSVEVGHFAQARSGLADPQDQAGLSSPRLGFYGVIDERFDTQLVAELAAAHPEWAIVLLGPVVKVSLDELPHAANIHYLGQKSYAELPAYLAHWDVALLPFARNEATEFISPTKTPEYLAAGVPAVSTAIRDVVRPYGEQGMLRVADDAEGFGAAVAEILAERGTPAAEQRQQKADRFLATLSWDHTWNEMAALMDTVAAGRAAPTSRATPNVEAADD